MAVVHLLVVVSREQAARYHKALSAYKNFQINLVSDVGDALEILKGREKPVDVLVLDNNLGQTHKLVLEIRQSFSQLIIVLVDEEADFATPGHADEISTEPFSNDDLMRRIMRLMSDRRLETLRADAMPPVREVAKKLRMASGEMGKAQAAVSACRDMGYDYVAFYRLDSLDPFKLTLRAQDGPNAIQSVAPKQANPEDMMAQVAKTGQSRLAAPADEVNHPLVARGRLGAAACVAVGTATRLGVLLACNEQPGTINQQNLLMLELVSAQLAAVMAKEIIG